MRVLSNPRPSLLEVGTPQATTWTGACKGGSRCTCQVILHLLRIVESAGHRASINGARERRVRVWGRHRLCVCRTHVQPLGTPVSQGGTRQGRGRDGEGPSSVPQDTAHRRLRAAWGPLPLRADPQQAAAEPGAPLLAKARGSTVTFTHCTPETEESLPCWSSPLCTPGPQSRPLQTNPWEAHTQRLGLCQRTT